MIDGLLDSMAPFFVPHKQRENTRILPLRIHIFGGIAPGNVILDIITVTLQHSNICEKEEIVYNSSSVYIILMR